MKLTVIVPVYNGGEDIRRCLDALANCTRVADSTIVVDDGSTDRCAHTASKHHNAAYLCLEDGPKGPARARNAGVNHISDDTDIVVFIDADVVVHSDTLEQIEQHFNIYPDTAALFGSYDDQPFHRTTVSIYRNLLHHHVHQTGNPDAKTFWAGCGAVRYRTFNTLKGFSEDYAKPSIEDIEFGARLHQLGHSIKLCPDIQVTHLKQWTLGSMIKTDVFARAVPWTRLLHTHKSHSKDLNLNTKSRWAAIAALVFVASLCTVFFVPLMLLFTLLLATAFVAIEFSLFALLLRKGGLSLALPGFLLHILYYCYATAAFVFTRFVMLFESDKRTARTS